MERLQEMLSKLKKESPDALKCAAAIAVIEDLLSSK